MGWDRRAASPVLVVQSNSTKEWKLRDEPGQPLPGRLWFGLFFCRIGADHSTSFRNFGAASAHAQLPSALHVPDPGGRRSSGNEGSQKPRLAMGTLIPSSLQRNVLCATPGVLLQFPYRVARNGANKRLASSVRVDPKKHTFRCGLRYRSELHVKR